MLNNQLLIIDDDVVLTEMLVEYLSEESYQVEVVHDGLEGLNKARSEQYDLIILDVMLPSLNGMEVLKRLREKNGTPVLMLTARGDDLDRILGLEVGADDYLAKPFNTRELVARIRAILRRVSNKTVERIWKIGDLHVDTQNWQAKYQDTVIEFTTTEFQILNTLYQSLGTAVSREILTEEGLGRVDIKSARGIGYVMVKKV